MKEIRRWLRMIMIMLLVLVLGALAVQVYRGFSVRRMLSRAWDRGQMVCRVHMEVPEQVDGIALSWDNIGEERYFTVDAGTESIYLHDGNLYFPNGTGYDLKGLWEDIGIPEKLIRNLAFVIPFERYFDGGYDASVFEVSGEPGFFLEKFFPEACQYWDQLQSLKIGFYEEAGQLRYILICHDSLYLYLELTDEAPEPIPTELLMQMGRASLPDIRTLEPVLRACMKLNQPGTVLADLSIHVDCGPLPIQDNARIMLSEEGLYLARGDNWSELTPEGTGREELLMGLGWMLVQNGVWEPEGTDSGTFCLTIPSEDLKDGILSIIPELDGLNLTLDDGILTISIAENRFNGIILNSSGRMPFLITTIPLSVQLELSLNR